MYSFEIMMKTVIFFSDPSEAVKQRYFVFFSVGKTKKY
jgi:hypothetical protein